MTQPIRGELLARGGTAEVYAWSNDRVLKLFFDWCPPDWIQNEVNVGRALASTLLPTPRLLDTVSLDGRQGIIFDRVEGASMLSLLSTKPWLLSRMARQFAELHAAIHDNTMTNLPPLRPYLHTVITSTKSLPPGLKSRALTLLGRLPDGDTLCHFDFHPGQVAIANGGPVILDWMTALKGHPLADVAKTSVLIRFGQPPHASWLMRTATNLVRRGFHRGYIRRYLRLHPEVHLSDIQPWMIPVAAARVAHNVAGERERILAFLETSLSLPMAA